MGDADSTTNVGNVQLLLFNAYWKNKFRQFVEEMTEEYVE